jgi:thymidylate kinase
MYGYALAYYAWLRDEAKPDWVTYLDTNPRVFLKRGLRFLRGREA